MAENGANHSGHGPKQGARPEGFDAAAGAKADSPLAEPFAGSGPRSPKRKVTRSFARLAGRFALWLGTFALTLALCAGLVLMLLAGRPFVLPAWAVARIETQINDRLASDAPELALALGGAEVMVESNLAPRLRLRDARLTKGQTTLVALPELRLTVDLRALLTEARVRPAAIALSGLDISLLRGADGAIDFGIGGLQAAGAPVAAPPPLQSLSDAFARLDAALAAPILAGLSRAEVEGATITLRDLATGRDFVAGDGRVVIERGADRMAAELALSLISGVDGRDSLGQAVVTMTRPAGRAELTASLAFSGISTRDLASEFPLLAPLGAIDAPVAGDLLVDLTDQGSSLFQAQLELGAGALRPRPDVAAVPFDQGRVALSYDAQEGRILLTEMSVKSPVLRLSAKGEAQAFDAAGQVMTGPMGRATPASFKARLHIAEGQFDPQGAFEAPLRVASGALDFSLSLQNFGLTLDQAQIALDDGQPDPPVLRATGEIMAVEGGWAGGGQATLSPLAHDRLLALWPQTAVPKTREWLIANISAGKISNLLADVTLTPQSRPDLRVSYDFEGASVRFMPALPPVTGARGRGILENQSFRIELDAGQVDPGDGGPIAVAGSSFAIPDVAQKPAMAQVDLVTSSSLRATLTLLDLPPFRFLDKANQTPEMAEGAARTTAQLEFPLKDKVMTQDVVFTVTGTVTDLVSDRLVKGKVLTSPDVGVSADNTGLLLTGQGGISDVPFDFLYRQDFGPAADGARVTGTAPLSQTLLDAFSIRLPKGFVRGKAQAEFDLALKKGETPVLRLRSDLQGISMALDALGWGKAAAERGSLSVTAELSTPPRVTELSLDAAGLRAQGDVTLRDGGGLDVARFSQLSMEDWFDGPIDLIGTGEGRPIDIAVRGGVFDLRRFDPPEAAGGSTAAVGNLTLQLDELRVTDSYFLRGAEGAFAFKGGFNGNYRGSLNGDTPVTGAVVPSRHGTAIRLQAADAGAALAAAGIFSTALGGTLDLAMTPRPAQGSYDATVEIRDIRARKTSALAELLSAVSVVGLLEQLQGTGILFSRASFNLVVTPRAVEISSGSATGASLGLSVAGLYGVETRRLDLQGVLSPVYLLNGIGEAFTQRGEGVFGFNYRIGGSADAPEVSVNPLSVLTPGIFREIFRNAPPTLGEQGG